MLFNQLLYALDIFDITWRLLVDLESCCWRWWVFDWTFFST